MADYKNPYLGENPYLQGQIDAAQGDLTNSYNMTTQPAYNTAMVKSGSFGNSGVQQMNENAQSNLQKNLGRVSSDMRNQDQLNQQNMYRWDQEFGRNTFNDAFSQNQSNAVLGMNWLGQLNGYNQQDLNNATTIQNTPLNYYGQFANTANAAGGMGGTSTIQQGTSSSPLTAALGGAQLGSSAMNYWQQRQPASLNNNGDSSWASGNSYGGNDYGASSGGDYGQFF